MYLTTIGETAGLPDEHEIPLPSMTWRALPRGPADEGAETVGGLGRAGAEVGRNIFAEALQLHGLAEFRGSPPWPRSDVIGDRNEATD